MTEPILRVENLSLSFVTENGTVPVLHHLSYSLPKGKILAVVGESGSGKTVQALSILKLLAPNARVDSGKVIYRGKNLKTFHHIWICLGNVYIINTNSAFDSFF